MKQYKNSKYKYTYYHYNPLPPHIHTPHITKQVKTTTVQDTHQIK